jgi:hypothetical protein
MVAQEWEQCMRTIDTAGKSASVIKTNLVAGADLPFNQSIDWVLT